MHNQTKTIAILLGAFFLQTSYCQNRTQSQSSQSFYPLGIGDRWEYDDYAWGGVGVWDTLDVNIDKDTSFGGHTYFIRSGRSHRYGNSWRDFQRVDSSGDVLSGDPATLNETLVYRLSDTSRIWWFMGGSLQRFDSCAAKTLFGALRTTLYVGDYRIVQSDTNLIGSRVLMEGIGWYTTYVVVGDIGGTFLRGARINGTVIGDLTDVREHDDDALLNGLRLEPAYPNPFNPTTRIRYTVGRIVALSGAILSGAEGPASTNVRLVVYDILGREVSVLVNRREAPGNYEVSFDGWKLSTGVYFYRLTAGSFVASKSMILIR